MDNEKYWFDERGYLAPYQIIEITLQEFESFFVDGLADRRHRRQLFGKYLMNVQRIREVVGMPLFQWVGGSFITLKEFPGDIDMVTFLKAELYERFDSETSWLQADAVLDFKLHSFFAAQPDEEYPAFEKHREKRLHWKQLFGYTREDRGIRYPKGIVQINFEL